MEKKRNKRKNKAVFGLALLMKELSDFEAAYTSFYTKVKIKKINFNGKYKDSNASPEWSGRVTSARFKRTDRLMADRRKRRSRRMKAEAFGAG